MGAHTRVTSVDWKARAEREAAAIIAGMDAVTLPLTRDEIVSVLAVAWLQGVNYGSHETLADVEQGFERLRASL